MFYLGFFMYYFLFIKKERSAFSFVFLFFLLFFTMTLCFAADRDDFSEDGSGTLKFNKSARGKDTMSVVTSVKGKTMAIFSNREKEELKKQMQDNISLMAERTENMDGVVKNIEKGVGQIQGVLVNVGEGVKEGGKAMDHLTKDMAQVKKDGGEMKADINLMQHNLDKLQKTVDRTSPVIADLGNRLVDQDTDTRRQTLITRSKKMENTFQELVGWYLASNQDAVALHEHLREKLENLSLEEEKQKKRMSDMKRILEGQEFKLYFENMLTNPGLECSLSGIKEVDSLQADGMAYLNGVGADGWNLIMPPGSYSRMMNVDDRWY
ncbi:hypothetical protein [Endozoicomonas sp. Mp262]|uniref:hypothetical protein n=1 Tax=Endozoicomonas sp. Mp262 TaxID=2919499 RepID=UPI0021DA4891